MVFEVGLWTLGSVVLVSLLSFIGIFLISLRKAFLQKILLFLVSFAVGALFGDALIHLLPEAVGEGMDPLRFGLYAVVGILVFFMIEKFLRWKHRHVFEHKEDNPHLKEHPKPLVWMNLFGDGVHNFIDGMLIAGSYLVSIPLGITTTVAVLIHEGAQEIGDFAVLIKGGLSRKKALFYNFLSALTAVVGGMLTLVIGSQVEWLTDFLVPFTFAGFLYLALATLIPELHHEDSTPQLWMQVVGMVVGVLVMVALLFVG
jgi:zinc and cadmium transporter